MNKEVAVLVQGEVSGKFIKEDDNFTFTTYAPGQDLCKLLNEKCVAYFCGKLGNDFLIDDLDSAYLSRGSENTNIIIENQEERLIYRQCIIKEEDLNKDLVEKSKIYYLEASLLYEDESYQNLIRLVRQLQDDQIFALNINLYEEDFNESLAFKIKNLLLACDIVFLKLEHLQWLMKIDEVAQGIHEMLSQNRLSVICLLNDDSFEIHSDIYSLVSKSIYPYSSNKIIVNILYDIYLNGIDMDRQQWQSLITNLENNYV